MTRRQLLLAAGASVAAAQTSLKSKAKKNLKLGVFTNVYSRFPVAEAAAKIRAHGFEGVVLEYRFADVRFDPNAPDWGAAAKIVDTLGAAGLKIACLAGYYNVVAPDPDERKKGEAAFRCLVENWRKLGSPIVATETGTLNRKSQWLESPENAGEPAYESCRKSLAELARVAAGSGAVVAIEPYWRNIIDSPARAGRLFRDVNSPALKLVMDPCNYYRPADLDRVQPILREVFERVGRQTVIAHAKDVKPAPDGPDLPAAGLGVMDYPLFLRLLAGLDREMFLVVEHLGFEDVPRARDYVLAQFEKI